MKFIPLLLCMILALICACGTDKSKITGTDDSLTPDEEAYFAETSDVQPTTTATTAIASNSAVRPGFIGSYDEVFNDSNYIQYASAEVMGIEPMADLADAYATRRPLVKIESNGNYRVDPLSHSMPYLVPEAAKLLDEIGKDFGDLVEKRGGDRSNQIIVTSVLRSPYSVKKLRRVNRNAVDSSTHMFATTFDISWARFYCPDSTKALNDAVLKGILAEVLLEKRNRGECWVKHEKKSPCFHITVNNPR